MPTALKIASTTNFTIDKGVPLPKRTRKHNYPFNEMSAGDSFVVPQDFIEKVRAACSYWGIRHPGEKFSIRKMSDGTYRCFRTA